ncbi:major facilitator superfamily domain-containing protein [Fusarium oxysporum f. sp. albedinis]|nr:major facilitator superfamily domain-containing protein [Fusarium oxysporum f. sp. albedinis]
MEALPLESTSSLSLKPGSDVQLVTVGDECSQEVVANSVSSGSLIRRVTAITYLCGMNLTSSASNGLIVIGLPRLTKDLKLPPSLAFWPSSVQGLTTASTLLLTGAIADVLGPRPVNLSGCILNCIFILTCGLVKNGEQLVVLRALQGIATALHLSSSVALVTQVQPQGRERNVAFACLGLSQLLGFSSSLVVGGILIDTLGWRSGCLISTGIDQVRSPLALVPLSLSMVATALFVYWMHSRVKRNRVALIPNGLWKNLSFTSICITVALSFAVLNSLDLVTSLYFQEIEHLSALEAAIRMLPSTVVGLALNITTGLVVHKIRANWLVAFASLISAGSPLLMAVIQPDWPYWKCAFPAQILMPFSIDVLFTIGLIIITEVFTEEQHAVAGAVFNTAAQLGNTMGLALMQVISTWVTKQQETAKPFTKALMEGYRATFWAMLALLLVCSIVGAIGLRRAGKVGLRHS